MKIPEFPQMRPLQAVCPTTDGKVVLHVGSSLSNGMLVADEDHLELFTWLDGSRQLREVTRALKARTGWRLSRADLTRRTCCTVWFTRRSGRTS